GRSSRKSTTSLCVWGRSLKFSGTSPTARGRGKVLTHRPLPNPRRSRLVSDNAYPRNLRHQLSQEVEPFGAQAIFEQGEAGHIAAWPCQAIHNPGANGIDGLSEYYWDCARGLLQGWCCRTDTT